MPEKSVVKRSWRSLVGQPIKDKLIKMPKFEENDDGTFCIEIEEIEKKGIDISKVEEYQKSLDGDLEKGISELFLCQVDRRQFLILQTNLIILNIMKTIWQKLW